MIVLGINFALVLLGRGIICEEGPKLKYISSDTIKTITAKLMPLRLAEITLKLEEIIAHYKPALIVMEETFINSNVVSSLKLGYIKGAIHQ